MNQDKRNQAEPNVPTGRDLITSTARVVDPNTGTAKHFVVFHYPRCDRLFDGTHWTVGEIGAFDNLGEMA